MASHLQVWDWVEHDDADRTARRNRAPEAEFLELETLEQFEIDEPPPHPDATFSDLRPGGDDADPLLHFFLPPEGFRPSAEEAIPGGVRWYSIEPDILAGEEEFQRLFDKGGEELELKLTREQYEILRAPGPVLLAGSAGSGKTTIAVHRLAGRLIADPPPSALYLSYSPALVEHARALYRDLALARGADPDRHRPDFLTFGELYRSLIPRELQDHHTRPMTERRFREWFRMSGRALDPALVWEELRSILKGACLSLSRPMLDEAAYAELGRKRAPLFVDERPEIYRIAQRYQEWLAEEGRSDRIDLCRRAFAEHRNRRGRAADLRTWDLVVCDEVQDLTELEVAFVLSLSRRPDLGGLLLTGDTQQIVNPSGFRWAEARRLAGRAAHRREAPAVLRLRRNLRSVRPLVELANALLLLRREIYGRTEEDEPEEASIEGPPPVEVRASEEETLAAISGFGPRCAVLTLDDEEAERLRARLGTERVFHVREAKGLEFETVVLWKLLTPDRDLVARFGRAGLEREPRFQRLLQHLYVAATRARRHLAIYEGPDGGAQDGAFWTDRRFRGLVERAPAESLAHLFHATASPADWAREGEYFEERGHCRQAAECYRRAGLPERETAALARADEEREDWAGALARWQALGHAARQAPLLERLGRVAEAIPLYRQAGLEEQARACEIRLLESRRAWKAAAEGWQALGRHADAARCWERAGDPRRARPHAAQAAEEAGAWPHAGDLWLEAGDLGAAVRCFEAAGDRLRAALARARIHEAAGDWRRAAAAWRAAGQPRNSRLCRARALEAAGRLERAALLRERLGEAGRAVELYARAGRWLDVARLEPVGREEGRLTLPRIRELIEIGSLEDAAELGRARQEAICAQVSEVPWFLLDEGERLAWQELRTLTALEDRCRALQAEAGEAWSRATRLWLRAGEPGRADEARGRRGEALLALRPRALSGPADIRQPETHPDREAHLRLVRGTAAPEEARRIVRHLLQACPVCGRLAEEARRPAAPPATSYDEALDRVARSLRQGRLHSRAQERAHELAEARDLYAELLSHEAVEGLVQVHSTRRYATLALCELLLQRSRDLALDDPGASRKAADLAVRVSEQLDLDLYGAPVVQDLRAVAWAYLAESRRVHAELRLAESAMGKAERLLAEGSGDPRLRAELLGLQASLASYGGRFEEGIRLLDRAASIYRRLGERHLLGRTLLKKGTLLGNAGQREAATRLIRRSMDLIDPSREPRLLVYATHNYIWFLSEDTRDGRQLGHAAACLDGARRLYERAGDRRDLGRLRWLEGKLAARPRDAEGALLAAREELAREGLAYEAALAAMDLAVLYAGESRGADMRRQADLMFPLFRSDDMYRETMAALLSFEQGRGQGEPARLIEELGAWLHRSWREKNPPALAVAPP